MIHQIIIHYNHNFSYEKKSILILIKKYLYLINQS